MTSPLITLISENYNFPTSQHSHFQLFRTSSIDHCTLLTNRALLYGSKKEPAHSLTKRQDQITSSSNKLATCSLCFC